MNMYKVFSVNFIKASFVFILFLISMNYIIDPYNIFHTKYFPKQFQQNERFNKAEFLSYNPSKYDSYILGSSRVGNTEPTLIEKYIPNSIFYNYYVSGGTLYDDLENLKFAIKNTNNVKNIYLQIDIIELLYEFKHAPDNYLFRYSPELLNKSVVGYKLDYLMMFSYENIIGKIKQNIKEDFNYVEIDFMGTGCWYRKLKEDEILKNADFYITKEKSFHEVVFRNVVNKHLEDNINALKKIVNICKENNINLIVFTTPHNHKLMDSININDYIEALVELSSVVEYWDFSGYNSVTNNDINYYEVSHYRPCVSEFIAGKIFRENNISIPTDFGVYVTGQYLESYIVKKRKEILLHDQKNNL